MIRSCGREVLVAGAKAAGHSAPAVGTQKTMNAGSASCFLCSPGQTPAHGMALLTMMLGLTSQLTQLRNLPQAHLWGDFSNCQVGNMNYCTQILI